MELVNEFSVQVPIDQAWPILTNVELIAPCIPGAQLTEVEGDTYRGFVKVKLGPIIAQFKGDAQWVERNDATHTAVLKAAGSDTGGKGNAAANITAQLESVSSTETKVTVTTDLIVTGRMAQFGRGVLADVSRKLIGQFVTELENTVLNGPAAATHAASAEAANEVAATGTSAEPAVRKIEAKEAEALDLLQTAGGAALKRLVPVVVIAAAIVLYFVFR